MHVARVIFYDSEHGGRLTPPQAGFRPQLNINGVHTSCVVGREGDYEVYEFNKEYVVVLQLMYPNIYENPFVRGCDLELFEGSKLIGKGIVIDNENG